MYLRRETSGLAWERPLRFHYSTKPQFELVNRAKITQVYSSIKFFGEDLSAGKFLANEYSLLLYERGP